MIKVIGSNLFSLPFIAVFIYGYKQIGLAGILLTFGIVIITVIVITAGVILMGME